MVVLQALFELHVTAAVVAIPASSTSPLALPLAPANEVQLVRGSTPALSPPAIDAGVPLPPTPPINSMEIASAPDAEGTATSRNKSTARYLAPQAEPRERAQIPVPVPIIASASPGATWQDT